MSTKETKSASRQESISEAVQDTFKCWNELPHKLFFGALLAAWLLFFHFYGNGTFGYVNTPSLMGWMSNAYEKNGGQDGHGAFVPYAVLFLFWWKRKELLATPMRTWWPGLVMVIVALLLHVGGYLIQQPRISIVALFLGIYGLMGMAWGPKWLRESFFPFLLFIFCIPISSISESLTFPLRLFVATVSTFISQHIFGINVLRIGTQLFNPTHTYGYDVADACSGIQSLMAIIGLNTVFAFLFLRTGYKRLLMIATAIPLAIICNTLRLLMIIMAADVFGKEVGDYVHENEFFKLLPYLPAFAGVWLMGRWLEETNDKTVPITDPAPRPRMDQQPFILLVISLVLIGGTALGMGRLKESQKLGEPGIITTPIAHSPRVNIFLPETSPGYSSELIPTDTNMFEGLPHDTSFMQRQYTALDASPTNGPLGKIALDVVLMGLDRTSIHKPQFCLTGQGWNIDNSESGVETVRIEKPYPYDLKVMKLLSTREINYQGKVYRLRGTYVYWFIADRDLTPDHSTRMWHSVRHSLSNGELERWAYVSYFSICWPGQEKENYEKMKKFITATVPEYQLATNPRADDVSKTAAVMLHP